MSADALLGAALDARLDPAARAWLGRAREEVAHGDEARFWALLSQASRHAKDVPLAPTRSEREAAERALPGWNPERWTLREAARVLLVLSRGDLASARGVEALEGAFRYADEGELRALYRSLALLPEPRRLVWRAGEGCRTNMRSVFEAVALDTPYPVRWFDDLAWRQAVIKCIFIGAPLSRMVGLDGRLSEELSRMALDLADERRSAHREVQPDLWLCLGAFGGARALGAIEAELDPANSHTLGRRAAAFALARAGQADRLRARLAEERDAAVRATMQAALSGPVNQDAFRTLDPTL